MDDSFKKRLIEARRLIRKVNDSIVDLEERYVSRRRIPEVFPTFESRKEMFSNLHKFIQKLYIDFNDRRHRDELEDLELKCKCLQESYIDNAIKVMIRLNAMTGNDLDMKEMKYFVDMLNQDEEGRTFSFDLPPVSSAKVLVEYLLEHSGTQKIIKESPLESIVGDLRGEVNKECPEDVDDECPKAVDEQCLEEVDKNVPSKLMKNVPRNSTKNVPRKTSKNVPGKSEKNVLEKSMKKVPRKLMMNFPRKSMG